MILLSLQIAAIAVVALYFVHWRMAAKRRNAQSWDSMLARLRPEWSARELSAHFLWKEGLSATPEDAWQRMEGPKGLWVMYQNALILPPVYMRIRQFRQDRDIQMLLAGEALRQIRCRHKTIRHPFLVVFYVFLWVYGLAISQRMRCRSLPSSTTIQR